MRKPMAQFGEKVWFRKIGENGVSSFASRMTQGIFVGHHDRTGAVFVYYQEWSWARQQLDETATERCMECYELGWPVWHSVANGGAWVEIDEESYI